MTPLYFGKRRRERKEGGEQKSSLEPKLPHRRAHA